MKTRLPTLMLALALGSSSAMSQTIFGTYDCGHWFSTNQPINRDAKVWLMGYLSGMNAMAVKAPAKPDPLGKLTSADQAFLWMDNYCKANPLKPLTTGGLTLFIEVENK